MARKVTVRTTLGDSVGHKNPGHERFLNRHHADVAAGYGDRLRSISRGPEPQQGRQPCAAARACKPLGHRNRHAKWNQAWVTAGACRARKEQRGDNQRSEQPRPAHREGIGAQREHARDGAALTASQIDAVCTRVGQCGGGDGDRADEERCADGEAAPRGIASIDGHPITHVPIEGITWTMRNQRHAARRRPNFRSVRNRVLFNPRQITIKPV